MMNRYLLATVMMACALAAGPASARDRTTIDESFGAGALDLRGLAARVNVRLHDSGTIRLRATGPASWIGDLSRHAEDGALVVSAGPVQGFRAGSAVTIATGFGARAVTRIGGLTMATEGTGDGDLPEVELWVPAGTPLTATSTVGEWDIADLRAPLTIEVAAGQVAAGAVTDATVRILGSGAVTVARVDGDLGADLSGAGDITVAGGRVDMLTASIAGTGTIRVQAPAERADLAISGIGTIDADRIVRKPSVRVSGVGTVRTGFR